MHANLLQIGVSRNALLALAVGVVVLLSGGLSDARAQGYGHRPGEVLVKLRDGASEAAARAVAASVACEDRGAIGRATGRRAGPLPAEAPRGSLRRFHVPAGRRLERVIADLRAHPSVVYAEPNYIVRKVGVPNDARFSGQWALANTGQSGGMPGADIKWLAARAAFASGSDAKSIIVASIDTGVDYGHPDLAHAMWKNPGERPDNGVDDDGNGIVDDVFGFDPVNGDGDPFDDDEHGTHTAGTIAAITGNQQGIAGIAPNARIMALKFLDKDGFGDIADAIAALDYAVAHGARISNNSWGGAPYSQALFDAIADAGAAGHLFVCAAGNEETDNDATPNYPASYVLPNVITVAATDRSDDLAWFSNTGRRGVHLGAPGVDIDSTIPGNRYALFSGTSMASPHVAGVAAELLARYPHLSPSEVRGVLMAAADPLPVLQATTLCGGRLDADKAMQIAAAGAPLQLWAIAPFDGVGVDPGAPLKVTCQVFPATVDSVTARLSSGGTSALVALGGGVFVGEVSAPGVFGPSTLTIEAKRGAETALETLTVHVVQRYVIEEVPFAWTEIRASNREVKGLQDETSASVSIGFAFDLLGESFTSVQVNANGYLTFGHSMQSYVPVPLDRPNPALDNMLALVWADLNPRERHSVGKVYRHTTTVGGRTAFIVEYEKVAYYGTGGSEFVTAQAVLFQDTSEILLSYLDVETFTGPFSRGVRGRGAPYATVYDAPLQNQKTLRLTLSEPIASQTRVVTAVGQHGWFSGDTRNAGTIGFEVEPLSGRGALVLETQASTEDKATLDNDSAPFDGTVSPFGAGTVFTYEWLRASDATPTVAAVALKLGVDTVDANPTEAGAMSRLEDRFDKIFVCEPYHNGTTLDDLWLPETITATAGRFWLVNLDPASPLPFGHANAALNQSGKNRQTVLHTLAEWKAHFAAAGREASATITSVQLGIGSGNPSLRTFTDFVSFSTDGGATETRWEFAHQSAGGGVITTAAADPVAIIDGMLRFLALPFGVPSSGTADAIDPAEVRGATEGDKRATLDALALEVSKALGHAASGRDQPAVGVLQRVRQRASAALSGRAGASLQSLIDRAIAALGAR